MLIFLGIGLSNEYYIHKESKLSFYESFKTSI